MGDELSYRARPDEGRLALGLVSRSPDEIAYRTTRTPAVYIAALRVDPRTRRADWDPMPYPPPPSGAPVLWTGIDGGTQIRLRVYSGILDRTSPIVELKFIHDGTYCLVKAQLLTSVDKWSFFEPLLGPSSGAPVGVVSPLGAVAPLLAWMLRPLLNARLTWDRHQTQLEPVLKVLEAACHEKPEDDD